MSDSSVVTIAGRYVVERRIGQGATALVYRCQDRHTGQTVAVKLLRTGNPLVPASRVRFKREARLAAGLSHPNIIRVLDFGTTDLPVMEEWTAWVFDTGQQVDFLCMEYIPGPTLKQIVRRLGPLPQSWALALGLQLADALASAHASGVIHRDLKPQNMLLLDLATHAVAKLGDFGIARDLTGVSLSTVTQTGQVLGTPDYLAPEQVLGEAGGQQSDVYALGIVLYEIVTGRLPFEAETPLAAASRRMFVDPPPPRSLVPTIGRALEETIMRALRRDPANRLRSAAELLDALLWAAGQDESWPDDFWPFGAEALPLVGGAVAS
jgi:serine/threonine protein kinase